MPASDADEIMSHLDSLSDPYDVLKLLSDKLGNEGNIKDMAHISFFRRLMTESDKLVGQCMFINVLQATKDTSLIPKILKDGAWKTLYGWLQDAKSGMNRPFLLELLRLYLELPVTVDLLKQNSCAKDIKHLGKCSDKKVSELAQSVVDKWMMLVKEKTGEVNKKNDKGDTSNHTLNHLSSKSFSKDEKMSTKKNELDSNNSQQSSHKHRTAQDKTLSSSSQSSHGNSNNLGSSKQDASSSSVSKETVHRPKTVKMVGHMFRSTGLELESPLPHSRKKSSNVQSSSLPSLSVKASSSGSVEKKTSLAIPSSASTTSSSSSPTDGKPKIKFIPKAKPPEKVFESSHFMDAIGTSEIVPVKRKRKLSQSNLTVQKPSTSISSSVVASFPSPSLTEEKKPAVPSFYREIMEMSTEECAKLAANGNEKGNSSPNHDTRTSMDSNLETMDTREVENKLDETQSSDVISQNGSSNLSSDSGEPPLKKKKKTVSWPDDNKLCCFFYFQLDETERINVNKIDFAETRKHDLEMERQMFQNVRRLAHDTMAAKTQWRKPPIITGITTLIMPGCNSNERKVQIEREQSVLQVLYFTKSMIPDNPVEADLEYVELIEPKEIPLTDESGTGEVCYDHIVATSMSVNNPEVVPLMNPFNNVGPGPLGGDMPKNSAMQPPQQMIAPLRPGSVPPFMRPMYNMPPNMQQPMPQQMPPNMNMPLMDTRPGPNNMGFEMLGPNQGNSMQGPMMPVMMPRPGMVQGGRGFPPMRPDFMMGPGPQSHPGMRSSRATVCNHFVNGYCRFGNNCRYLHQRGSGSPV